MRSGAALVLLLCATSLAAREPLDDSKSPRQRFNLELTWATPADRLDISADEFNRLVGSAANVEIRLDTSRYVGRNARIFLALPAQLNGLAGSDGLKLSWNTRGDFLPGHVTPGNNALIFEGPIDDPLLREFFSFTMEIDARQLTGRVRIEPAYEIEPF